MPISFDTVVIIVVGVFVIATLVVVCVLTGTFIYEEIMNKEFDRKYPSSRK